MIQKLRKDFSRYKINLMFYSMNKITNNYLPKNRIGINA